MTESVLGSLAKAILASAALEKYDPVQMRRQGDLCAVNSELRPARTCEVSLVLDHGIVRDGKEKIEQVRRMLRGRVVVLTSGAEL